jgi:hypothetical protein
VVNGVFLSNRRHRADENQQAHPAGEGESIKNRASVAVTFEYHSATNQGGCKQDGLTNGQRAHQFFGGCFHGLVCVVVWCANDAISTTQAQRPGPRDSRREPRSGTDRANAGWLQ